MRIIIYNKFKKDRKKAHENRILTATRINNIKRVSIIDRKYDITKMQQVEHTLNISQ